ncbi:MAG: NADH-quinone oxidoreductase subunit K, partial [Anaerolineae bacterium]|nr:NADH-quinone oxidoreductase subunit K [Anaerolineae bacterium]
MNLSTPTIVLISIFGLLGIGFYGILISRHMIKVVVALQVLAKGAMIALVLAGRASGSVQIGQSLALTVIVADTIVAVVALALAVQVRRLVGTLDVRVLTNLRR